MKKKLIVILLALLVPAASLMATPWIQLGGNVSYGVPVDIGSEDNQFVEGFTDIANYKFGAEARLNLFNWVSLTVPGTFALDFSNFQLYPSVNLNLPLGPVDVAVGIGTSTVFARNDNGEWYLNGFSMGDAATSFLSSNFMYRGAVTINIGFLGIGVSANVPASGPLKDMDEIDTWAPNWESTTISASVLLNLF